jgi:hypothetical protein
MSTTQNEQDVLREGRKNTLGKEALAPLRDRMVDALMSKITADDVKLGNKITQAWNTATTNISPALEKQQEFLADLDNFRTNDTDPSAFGGASNLHLPMAFTVVKSYHSRFMEALLGVDPPFSMKARREDGSDRVQACEDLMRYTLMSWANRYRGVEDTIDAWLWNWCGTGTGIMKMRWNTIWEQYMDVRDVYTPVTPLSQTDDQGQEILLPQWRHEEVEQEVTKKVFDGIQFDVINLEDFRMIGGGGDPDLADMVMHRTFMTASELWTKVDQGIYREEVVQDIIDSGKDDPQYGLNSEIKQQRKLNAGEAMYTDDTHLDRYAIIEAILKFDANGSGITTDIVVTVEQKTSKPLSCTYLRRIMPSGERPYSVAHFHKRPGEWIGLGLLEILNPLTTELDMMHNIRIDNALFESTPFYIYRNTASFDPESVVIEPGTGIGVDSIDDIMFPSMPSRTGFTAQEEQTVQQYIEKLTGISDLSLGIASSTQGALRTASGVRAVMGENNNNLSVHLRRLNKAWSKVLTTTWHMLQNRVEPGFSFRITGDDGGDIYRKMSNVDLAMEADFELSANSSNSNKAVQIELGQQLVNSTMNPLLIQLGVTDAGTIYQAIKMYYSANGLKEINRYFKKPKDYTYMMDAQEEFSRISRGEPVTVAPQMDHAAFIAFADSFIESQKKPGGSVLSPDQMSALIAQRNQHQQMQGALQAQQAQQAQSAQVQQNMGGGQQVQAPGPSFANQSNNVGQVFQ